MFVDTMHFANESVCTVSVEKYLTCVHFSGGFFKRGLAVQL